MSSAPHRRLTGRSHANNPPVAIDRRSRRGLPINRPAPGLGIRPRRPHAQEPAIATLHHPRTSTPRPTGTPPGTTPHRVTVLLPAALSLALGLWGVRRGGALWRDEAVTYDMAHRELPQLWATLGNADAVHGLYYLLTHALFRLTGDADPVLVMRLPSVLAAAVACGLLALLGLRLAGPRAGLAAGLVLALLPQTQRYAQEGRSYTLVCALVIGATYVLLRAVESDTRRVWTGYATLMLLACLLHEFAVLALPAHALALPARHRRTWLWAALPVCALLAPLALLSVGQSEQVGWIGGIKAGAVAGFAGMSAAGLACAMWLRRQHPETTRPLIPLPRLALPLLTLPPAILLLTSLAKPLYVDRYVLYANAGGALLLGAVLGRARPRVLLAAGAAVLALLPYSLHLRTPESRLDDLSAIGQTLRAAGQDADGIVYLPGRRRVWTLADPSSVATLQDLALAESPSASHTLYGTETDPDTIRARMVATPRILAVTDPPDQPQDQTPTEHIKRTTLATSFERCAEWDLRGARVELYAHRGKC
ncbi:glycosyltransferase family 39 protein [Streptomyces sp. NPDC048290]|uniref:glycosyltransferase family 39 protein n=1 Tax=Streptomyces sp. NPDC048290 TaxID=3155811 RepID=UPI0034301818